MASYGISNRTDDRVRQAYGRFLNSPVSENVEPNELVTRLVEQNFLNQNEAEMVRCEENLPIRQLRLFITILSSKGESVFEEMESILRESGYEEAAQQWSALLIRKTYYTGDNRSRSTSTELEGDSGFLIGTDFAYEVEATGGTLFGAMVCSLITRDGQREQSAPARLRDASSLPSLPTGHRIKSIDVLLDRRIGEGTFGDVFVGHYGNQKVAVKTLKACDEFAQRMFRSEVNNIISLDHPNVVKCIGCVFEPKDRERPDRFWILTEFIDGGDMRRFCKPREEGALPLEFSDKVRIAKCCWRGLDYLHGRSLCHRDLAPDNIFASENLKLVKIGDFGLAEFKEWNRAMEYFADRCGKEMYLPPECSLSGSGRWNWQKRDVYSMGATLCELFSGQYFWNYCGKRHNSNKEVSDKLEQQLKAYQSERRQIYPDCWSSVPENVQNVLNDAIRVDYENRKKASEMYNAMSCISA